MENCKISRLGKIMLLLSFTLLLSALPAYAQTTTQDRNAVIQDVSFKRTEAKDVIKNIARLLGWSASFDESVKSAKMDFTAREVTMPRVLSAVLVLQGLQAKLLDERTILVFADTPENQAKFAHLQDWSARLVK